jgi:hypothetical protein
LLLLALNSVGQTVIERVNQQVDYVQLHQVLPYHDGSWLFIGSSNPESSISSPLHFIQLVSSDGAVDWEYGHQLITDPFAHSYNGDSQIKGDPADVLPDSSIMIIGPSDECDTPSWMSKAVLLSSQGEPIWDTTFMAIDGYGNLFDRMATNTSQNVALASSDSVIILDSDGAFVNKWGFEQPPIHCLRWESDTTLLIAADSQIFRTDINGSISSSQLLSQSDFGIDIRRFQDEVWVLTQNNLDILTHEFEPVSNIDLSSIASNFLDFVDVQDEVWITNGDSLWGVNSGHELVPIMSFSYGNASVAYQDSMVMTASTVSQINHTAGMMKSYLIDGSHVQHNPEDIEMSFEIDSIQQSVAPYDGIRFLIYTSYSVTNRSQEILQSLLVSTPKFIGAFGLCGIPSISQSLTNLDLGFGGSFQGSLSPITSDFYYNPFFPDSVFEVTVCVYGQSPNNHLDNVPTDNVACDSFTFYVGVDEASVQNIPPVYPNPTRGIVNLPQIENLNWQLFDVTGRHITQGNQETQIDISAFGLAEHIYFLQLATEEFNVTEKIIYKKE